MGNYNGYKEGMGGYFDRCVAKSARRLAKLAKWMAKLGRRIA
jgi:hypothetical protein